MHADRRKAGEGVTVSDVVRPSNARSIAAGIARKLRAEPWRWVQGEYVRESDCGEEKRCLAAQIWLYFPGGTVPADVYDVFVKACGDVCLSDWNDRKSRTVEDVIALCEGIANG